jgi:hypothetical protein
MGSPGADMAVSVCKQSEKTPGIEPAGQAAEIGAPFARVQGIGERRLEMPTKKSSSNEDPKASPSDPEPEHEHRKHGYRGYPNNPEMGGAVHSGTGFTGAGSLSGPGSGSSDSGILTEHTEKSLEELEEEEEEK